MTEPERHLIGLPVEATVQPEREVKGLDDITPGLRVESPEYGTGTVLADVGIGIQIYWDKPLLGTVTQMLVHDKAYVARLERL